MSSKEKLIDPSEVVEKYRQSFERKEPTMQFSEFLNLAVFHDYLLITFVSSHTQGRIKSRNLPFGVGKTTFGMWTSYITNATPGSYPNPKKMSMKKCQEIITRFNPFDLTIPEVQHNWDKVFGGMTYTVLGAFQMVKPGAPRRKIVLWDDTPATAPAEKGVPRVFYKFKGYITTTRPEIACLMMTGSNRNEVCAPIRKLIAIEIIIAERGVYEVQQVKYYKNYRRPELDMGRLEYMEEGIFPPLPQPVQIRYNAWRVAEKMKIFPDIEKELAKWLRLTGEEFTGEYIDSRVLRSSGYFVIKLPEDVGKKFHHEMLRIMLPSQEKKELSLKK